MFFNRKRRNRRLSRDHVLDVKLSASQRHRFRVRRVVVGLGSALILFLTLFLGWHGGELAVRHFVYQNPAFGIRILRIDTDGVLSSEQIRTWAGVKYNDNLLALDLARVERDLKLVPAIESVVVERALPRTLSIRVTEREPIAQVLLPAPLPASNQRGGAYTLDASGYFMFPVDSSQRLVPAAPGNIDHLPVLTGIPSRDIRPGKQSDAPQVRAALGLIRAFERSPMAGLVDLKQVEVSVPGTLVVTTWQGNEVTFGLQDPDAQLRRWRLVHDHAQRFGKHITALDLGVANNSPLLWTDLSGAEPPPAPKPVKASPYRKKHV